MFYFARANKSFTLKTLPFFSTEHLYTLPLRHFTSVVRAVEQVSCLCISICVMTSLTFFINH